MERKAKASAKLVKLDEKLEASDRIARILALMAIRDLPAGEQVMFLRTVGFSIAETAYLLRISDNQVSVSMNQAKGRKPSYLATKKNG